MGQEESVRISFKNRKYPNLQLNNFVNFRNLLTFVPNLKNSTRGQSPLFCYKMVSKLVSKENIHEIITPLLKEKEGFVVDVTVSTSNKITVQVDSHKGFTIDDCVDISRLIEQSLDRDKEDFELEVSTPGLTSPFKVMEQYKKNEGSEVEVLLKHGQKIKGQLVKAGDDEIQLTVKEKEKKKGNKKVNYTEKTIKILFDDIKSTKAKFKF